jgi:hypothetical protein
MMRLKAKTTKTKIKHSIRAISPVISVLMIIAIAVASSLVAYAWMMGYIGRTANTAGKNIQVKNVSIDPADNHHLLVYVQNVGQSAVTLDSVYVYDIKMGFSSVPVDKKLNKGDKATLTITLDHIINFGEKVKVKVVTTDGTFTEITDYVQFGGGGGVPVTQYTITVTQTGNGNIAPGTSSYAAGSTPSFTITPSSGYHILSITANGNPVTVTTPAGQSYQFPAVTAAGTLTATYAINTFTITVTQIANGNINPGTTAVIYGDTPTFSITPDTGYHIVSITANGNPVSVTNPAGQNYQFPPVTADGSLTATFGSGQLLVTFTASGLDSDTGSNTILKVGTTTYTWNTLPSNLRVDSGTTFIWENLIAINGGEQFALTAGSSGTVSASGTISATYQKQYLVTFDRSGLSSDATGTVATIAGIAKVYGDFPVNVWVDASTGSVTYAFTRTVTSSVTGKQFLKTSTDNSPVTGLSGPIVVTGTYTTQNKVTLSYSVIGGGSGYSAPTFTANSKGVSTPQTLTTTPTDYWFDAGASWTITNPLGGSSGTERWSTTQLVNGTVSISTIAFVYYHQYSLSVTASPGGAVGGTFQVTYTQFGTQHTNEQHATTWNSWADASVTPTVTVSSPQSPYGSYTFSSYTNNPATVSSPQTITLVYLPPPTVSEVVTITPANGYSSSTSVTVSGAGASVTSVPMDGQPHTFTANPSSVITFTVPADGSNTRYRFNNAGSASTTWSYTTASSGTDTKPNKVYYQVSNTFSVAFNGVNPGNGDSVALTGTYVGAASTVATLNSGNSWSASAWSDYNVAATFPTSTTNSSSNERWSIGSTYSTSALTAGGNTYSPSTNYYHQYSLSVTASPSGALGGTFQVTYYQFSSHYTNEAHNTGTTGWSSWADANSSQTATISSPQNPVGSYTFSSYSPSQSVTMNQAQRITLVYAPPPLALDGSNSAHTSSNSVSVTLTTTHSPDVIYVVVGADQGTINTPTASGLTFTKRTEADGTNARVATFYAIATSPLSSKSITVRDSSSSNLEIVVFGISGANTVTPFDSNANALKTNTGSGTSASVTGVSTSNANDFIIGALAARTDSSASQGSGFTLITQNAWKNNQNNLVLDTASEYKIVSSTQSGLTVPITVGASTTWAMIADAIVQAS